MSSGVVIPREEASEYEFWKLDNFEAKTLPNQGLPTVEELERIREQARAEGYQTGYEEGAHKARAEADRLDALLQNLDQELRQFDQNVADNLITLALEIARQVVRANVTHQPELTLAVVREAMEALPPFSEHAHLVLHPQDATLVRAHLAEQIEHAKWRLLEDSHMERGSARVETAAMQIDATLQARWQRAVAALGRSDEWAWHGHSEERA